MRDLGTRDIVVVGGGLIGTAVGLGLATLGADVALLEGEDTNFHAARGNFGLVWSQSKGARGRDYASWTWSAVKAWPEFEADIRRLSGIDTHYRSGLGLSLCLSEQEFEKRAKLINRVASYGLPGSDGRMIGRNEVLEILPGIGPDVVGGSLSTLDGDCHSLALYRGLYGSFIAAGGKLRSGRAVDKIVSRGSHYEVFAGDVVVRGRKVVIAAGLGTNALAVPLGFRSFVRPEKGEILVTERIKPFLPIVLASLRQTPEGTVLMGDTKEDAGLDDRSTQRGMSHLASRAVRMFPLIGQSRVMRSWAALRVMTSDGDPVYDESPTHPGVFVASTHSGVTLAPMHCGSLARWIAGDQKPPEFQSFKASRFLGAEVAEAAHADH
ncbi:D-nopaline dehydrogenase [Allorhizobium ampelinum]|uniref:D-nopaline dehydrogenase n=2 Tax=Rhizobium/Agrobacterium group TaxID=227290 RepID=B9K478_ALLAM|nr:MULTISPECIES: FAD-dependent oxidoreductase [Rhizobium/Agrobacterium group]ACM39732.1 D-nopaline dehydrogenase [Allorhizobium ampelinum S4]ASK49756.1 FAD-binding oxidoreductase [Agrobacterium vitis]MCF1436648.1 FAD-binding oxidoreductase [Allorhizobium ampelinum]MCF1495912.1 FAD-binding oxidoreductase [Allorhizobium ampelinum]MUO31368.1 FAD-dependent oxidoreductase [Agrobacterium vitis]